MANDPHEPDLLATYKQIGETSLRLHIFLPDPRRLDGPQHDVRPVLVWFHGGGWRGGSPSQFYPQSRHFADRGVVCVSVEYRLAARHGTTPFEAVEDAFDAMRFVREHAPAWGGDRSRIGAGGGSAGGHLAAALATLNAEDLVGSTAEAERARPNLLILYNPVFDNGPEGGYGHDRLGERWRDVSPAHHLHANVPPTLVMLGDRDELLPVETVSRFTEGLDRLGVAHRVVVYPGAEHGFFNPRGDNREHYDKTLAEADRFLVNHGWLEPERSSRSTRPDR